MNTQNKMPRMVIGLIGHNTSDQEVMNSIQKALGEKQSVHSVLLSDVIRESVRTRGKTDSKMLQDTARTLRLHYGEGAWIERLLRELPKGKKEGVLIIDSISNPGEIDLLRELFGERALIMATDTIEIKQQKGIETEDRVWHGSDLKSCLQKADFKIAPRKSKQERLVEILEVVSRFSRLVESKEREDFQEEIHRQRKVA